MACMNDDLSQLQILNQGVSSWIPEVFLFVCRHTRSHNTRPPAVVLLIDNLGEYHWCSITDDGPRPERLGFSFSGPSAVALAEHGYTNWNMTMHYLDLGEINSQLENFYSLFLCFFLFIHNSELFWQGTDGTGNVNLQKTVTNITVLADNKILFSCKACSEKLVNSFKKKRHPL